MCLCFNCSLVFESAAAVWLADTTTTTTTCLLRDMWRQTTVHTHIHHKVIYSHQRNQRVFGKCKGSTQGWCLQVQTQRPCVALIDNPTTDQLNKSRSIAMSVFVTLGLLLSLCWCCVVFMADASVPLCQCVLCGPWRHHSDMESVLWAKSIHQPISDNYWSVPRGLENGVNVKGNTGTMLLLLSVNLHIRPSINLSIDRASIHAWWDLIDEDRCSSHFIYVTLSNAVLISSSPLLTPSYISVLLPLFCAVSRFETVLTSFCDGGSHRVVKTTTVRCSHCFGSADKTRPRWQRG